jgi:lysophospholipase L1-like esterase
MSARGRLLSGLVTIVIASAGFSTIGAVPAAAANSGNVEYVALGDSYAAGQGGGRYLNPCLQTAASYPELLDAEKRIDLETNPTCTGAKTADVADEQVTALGKHTRLVTLTVGAANLNLSGVLMACAAGTPDDCQDAIDNAFDLLAVGPGGESVLGGLLTDLYADVANAAPKALVVVTGYPLLFESPALNDPDADIKLQINQATAALNATIRQAVAVTHATGVDIVYVDVTVEFAGHGIGAAPELLFINPPVLDRPDLGLPDAFHPNAAGYDAYAKAISAALPKAWVDKQKQSV